MDKLTEDQIKALDRLDEALIACSILGTLEAMLPWCSSPDSINDVCDAVDLLRRQELMQRVVNATRS